MDGSSVWEHLGHFVTFRPTKEAISHSSSCFWPLAIRRTASSQRCFGPKLNDGDEAESVQMSQWIFLAASRCWTKACLWRVIGRAEGGNFRFHFTSSRLDSTALVRVPFSRDYHKLLWLTPEKEWVMCAADWYLLGIINPRCAASDRLFIRELLQLDNKPELFTDPGRKPSENGWNIQEIPQ